MEEIEHTFITIFIVVGISIFLLAIFTFRLTVPYRNCVPKETFVSTEESRMTLMTAIYYGQDIPKNDYSLCISSKYSACGEYFSSSKIKDIPVGIGIQLTGKVRANKPLLRGFSAYSRTKHYFQAKINDEKRPIWITHSTLEKFQGDGLANPSNEISLKNIGYFEIDYPSGTELTVFKDLWTCPSK